MKPYYTGLLYSLIIAYITYNTTLLGQTFERAEMVSGLGVLKENNGVAVADYDGDLDLDIFVVAKAIDQEGVEKSHSKLFRNNNNGTFTDVTQESGLVNLLTPEDETVETFALDGFKYGAFFGDYDNDGYPDLFFTHIYNVQLFHNEGDGTFVEVTEDVGIQSFNECRNTGASWFDYNNDGFLDIYINDWRKCPSNKLYKNLGNGTFQDVSDETDLNDDFPVASYTSIPFDFNSDGFMDLYVTNDFDKANDLYISQGGTSFYEDAQNYGADNIINDMGIAIGDFNLDGAFDMFISGIDENSLLQNDGTNNFTEESAVNNITETGWSWGTRFADFDLDGDEDLIIVNGYVFQDRTTENNVYYKNLAIDGQNGFEDNSEIVGFNDLTVSVEAVDFDYDNDGDLDIFVTNSDQSSFLYENKLLNFDEPVAQNWFKIVLQGTESNRDAIGTTVAITTNLGQFKRYYTGVGFISQSLQPVHFGLGNENMITELEIKWPSGLIETYQNLDANSIVRAIEGYGITNLDIEPSQKTYGCTDPDSCAYNPDAVLDDGSCTYLQSFQISGNTSSGFLVTETYTYPIAAGSTANWQISGGEIIEGQGTSTVTVKWGLNETGRLSVKETNGTCYSLEESIDIELNVNDIPENISIARIWNEVLLQAIRNDYARPTVHARNLFHSSIAIYDAWAIYDEEARPYLMGNSLNGFTSTLEDFVPIESIDLSRKKTISYAMYRLLSYRFQNSPNAEESQRLFDLMMDQLGYDSDTSTDYELGNAAALGNYIAETVIAYGSNDGSRELTQFDNAYYEPVNSALAPGIPTTVEMQDPNRWQPLSLDTFIDQSGNLIPGSTIEFLSPEWGNVFSFAMSDADMSTYQREGHTYNVFNDPGAPPYLSLTENNVSSDAYKLGFSMVSIWGSHLDPSDGVFLDISPGAIGNTNIDEFPRDYEDYPNFYNVFEGGDIGTGHSQNPFTGEPYEPNIVPRGDYARVLAEFWADGPDSETPPGHWFTILNHVSDHPMLEKKFQGQGDILDDLEWDVKSYFILGGTMHDAAISAWSIKGWYDYVRPVSAIRYMALLGQSTDETLSNYNFGGIPLVDGFVEVVEPGDPLSGLDNQHVGKIKLYTWRGPDFIDNEDTDEAGVDWILAENWWPYQRPTFVTPPFAGFVSGHSTYSRAAAEVMTKITGSEYFPGGMGEFVAKQNEFLVFEEGPSVDVTLQWATYRDASDQTSLSRIWGGIHPPADDIPGRIIGEKIGLDAFDFAVPYFSGEVNIVQDENQIVFPNPVVNYEVVITNTKPLDSFSLFDIRGRQIAILNTTFNELSKRTKLQFPQDTSEGLYILNINGNSVMLLFKN